MTAKVQDILQIPLSLSCPMYLVAVLAPDSLKILLVGSLQHGEQQLQGRLHL